MVAATGAAVTTAVSAARRVKAAGGIRAAAERVEEAVREAVGAETGDTGSMSGGADTGDYTGSNSGNVPEL